MHNENWDDLRYILCVAKTGSVLRAAKQLNVNHATVLRHVAAFEERHCATIFERTTQGYRLLPDSAHIIQAAQAAEAAIEEVGRLAGGGQAMQKKTIRMTSTDTLCAYVLPDFVQQMATFDQTINLALLSSNNHVDLLREQAHIVVRPAMSLGDDLIGEPVAELSLAAFASDAQETRWLGLTGPLTRSVAGKWMADAMPNTDGTPVSDSFITLAALASRGEGIAILPTYVGDRDPNLIVIPDVLPDLKVPIWIAHHIEVVETVELKKVQTQLARFLSDRMPCAVG